MPGRTIEELMNDPKFRKFLTEPSKPAVHVAQHLLSVVDENGNSLASYRTYEPFSPIGIGHIIQVTRSTEEQPLHTAEYEVVRVKHVIHVQSPMTDVPEIDKKENAVQMITLIARRVPNSEQ